MFNLDYLYKMVKNLKIRIYKKYGLIIIIGKN